ncbi:hypothetical protein WH158_11815 [Gluconobacter cerinus]|uniref:hypothetical protein n=1 Tax=Gluconobacter cerinus TaxID=38307 RepID=UPI0030A85F5A
MSSVSKKNISINRIYLDINNPRHEKFSSQSECINYLCQKENVLNLAKDIINKGINPLESIGVIKDGPNTYFSAEGNRRICALKLINDPELAPADLRREFRKLNANPNKIDSIEVKIFENRDSIRVWLDRTHAGFDEGRGRRQWNSEQKTRNSKYSKNDLALSILDIAEKYGMISKKQREKKLSTVQRYLSNPVMRDTLGISGSSEENIATTLHLEDFKFTLRLFIDSLINGSIYTRDNVDIIQDFSAKIRANPRYSNKRCEAWLLFYPSNITSTVKEDSPTIENNLLETPVSPATAQDDNFTRTETPSNDSAGTLGTNDTHPNNPVLAHSFNNASKKDTSISPPKKPLLIRGTPEIQEALSEIPSYKLQNIYYSICTISLKDHTPLLTVAAWVFLETLTALNDRNERTDFVSFLNARRMEETLGLGPREQTKGIVEALKRISEGGNSTKHNKTSSHFNSESLFNDLETLSPLILALAKNAKGKS